VSVQQTKGRARVASPDHAPQFPVFPPIRTTRSGTHVQIARLHFIVDSRARDTSICRPRRFAAASPPCLPAWARADLLGARHFSFGSAPGSRLGTSPGKTRVPLLGTPPAPARDRVRDRFGKFSSRPHCRRRSGSTISINNATKPTLRNRSKPSDVDCRWPRPPAAEAFSQQFAPHRM
jgi:hypothetical protein